VLLGATKKTKKESISKPKCYIGSKATEYTGEPTEKQLIGFVKNQTIFPVYQTFSQKPTVFSEN
jgi:hypothetical protein